MRNLLVAADKYAMDRLKLLYQNILGKNLDVENVATTLALADQHDCSKLKQTTSRCKTETEEGTHIFEIVGYSLKKAGIGAGKFIRSATFAVGGYDWAICFYPNGASQNSRPHSSIYLTLMTKNATAKASYELRLLNNSSSSGLMPLSFSEGPRVFDHVDATRFGVVVIPEKIDLAMYIKDDSITIECAVKVIKDQSSSETVAMMNSEIEVPPSDIVQHLGTLLETKQGADVTFCVGGEDIVAHKIVLAVRPPFFQAQLCGEMKEAMMSRVTIEDVQPNVFRALLHFVYTDSLPDMGNLYDDDKIEMMRHLLVAADKYAMDRLKLMCQNILAKNLDVENVATTLALADQYNCIKLKQVCVEFIASLDAMDAVMGTRGYADLKRTCPYALIDVLEKRNKARKTFFFWKNTIIMGLYTR
uniref:BTB domain-containing protein n=1 Tax=Leersia perrieri TaxID=77586 RepID=A0A0D9X5J3_9ORYZ